MRFSGRKTSIVASPVIVGAITILLAVVGVMLAYSANEGLPFVPTYRIKADLPEDGTHLVRGNEIREGGMRIGIVDGLAPVRLANGHYGTRIDMKLESAAGPLPADTRLRVRQLSSLGLKYVELDRGDSPRTLPQGATLPASQASASTDIDQVLATFDAATRHNNRLALDGYGSAFAGRGEDINTAVAALRPFTANLAPVAGVLAAPQTQLTRFVRELGDAARIVAPVAQPLASGFGEMADTFGAIARDPTALEATIAKTPSTLDVSSHSLHVQRPFLDESTQLSVDLGRATHELRAGLPDINPALEAGIRDVPDGTRLARETTPVLQALGTLVRQPTTNAALRGLTDTVVTLNPTLRYLVPFQTVCNYWNYEFTALLSIMSERDAFGGLQRTVNPSDNTQQRNNPNSMGSDEPANGEDVTPGTGEPLYGHGQPFGAAVDPTGNADCENGQRGYMHGRWLHGGDPKLKVVGDPRTPGSQGPTYTGRPRVPAGETYAAETETGPLLPLRPADRPQERPR